MSNYQIIYEKIDKLKIKGLGEKTREKLNSLGIYTLKDLIYFLPRAYEDESKLTTLLSGEDDTHGVVKGRVLSIESRNLGYRKSIVKARITDGETIGEVVWFNIPNIKYSIKVEQEYYFIGKIKRNYLPTLSNPTYKKVGKTPYKGRIKPIYSLVNGLSLKAVEKIIKEGLNIYGNNFLENIPEEVRKKYKIVDRKKAIERIHFPKTFKDVEDAKRRFAIEELLILILGITSKRYSKKEKKYNLTDRKTLVKKFMGTLSFDLTGAQKKVVTEVYKELNKGQEISRLIQGDVGSGKTIVALILLLYIIENGYQGVLMAPTEVLATQHYIGIENYLKGLGIKVALLTGSVKVKERKKIEKEIESKEIDLVIGTHALIEDRVKFKNLGLTIIDEQHRFGVDQRKMLKDKGELSNLIVMSATPIPRSLALTLYGDLDVSIIDELPKGRKSIKTKWISDDYNMEKMYNFILKKLKEGDQCYFVAPLIEDSEKIDAYSATRLYEDIRERFSGYKVGLLHGRQTSKEKEEMMDAFKDGKVDILVSTTVIEVGVDVPNATVMTIVSSERFGLSALHQLRGRVGRGSKPSYCFLVSKNTTDDGKQRLEIMEETNDGFKIAEEDLKLRKSGEIFGMRQSGSSDLKFSNLISNIKSVELAREISREYLDRNNGEIPLETLKIDIEKKIVDGKEEDKETYEDI